MWRYSFKVRVFFDHSCQNVRRGVTLKDRLARKHLEQDAAECPDVSPLIDRLATGLLGRHIGSCAQDESRASGRNRYRRRVAWLARGGRLLHRLCQAEVQHLHQTVWRDLDVCRFEVSVHLAFLMRGFERFGDLTRNAEGLINWKSTLPDAIGQRRPF